MRLTNNAPKSEPRARTSDREPARQFGYIEDLYLADFFDTMGADFLSQYDGMLDGFTANRLKRRVAKLKANGAWAVLKEIVRLNNEYTRIFTGLDFSVFKEGDDDAAH